jgi:hypothetical protein
MMLKDRVENYIFNSEHDALIEYLDSIPRNESDKQELIEAIDAYDVLTLYLTLFCDFSEIMTLDEALYYRKNIRRFSKTIPHCFRL